MNQRKARKIRKLAENMHESGYDTKPVDTHMNHGSTRFKRLNRQLKKIAVTGVPVRDYIRVYTR